MGKAQKSQADILEKLNIKKFNEMQVKAQEAIQS